MQYKHFHDSLNVILILVPCYEFLSAKCVELPLTFTE